MLFSVLFFIFLFTWYGESRSFVCLNNGKCVTVWKTYNDICYIVPGKYYGLIRPSKNFIQSTNNNNLTIYFTSEMPKAFIFKSEVSLKINNDDQKESVFYDYNQDITKFDKVLYKPGAKRINDVKADAQLIDIIIHDDIAWDKNGKML